ncbi:MAG: FAD-dependent oxidoreductase [Candidatus Nealsonbacteria bacterium]|nr:FAD-dependent oxidoreductase [Candidatus Nealsonbacteria bacterium]
MDHTISHVLVCAGAGCVASGSLEVAAALREAVHEHGLDDEVSVIETGCLGPCAAGPVAVVYPDGVFYQGLKPEDAAEIAAEHLLKGRVVERFVRKVPATGEARPEMQQIEFFRRQQKTVLRNCGVIDPTHIEEYIARDGYEALAKVLFELKPGEVIDVVKRSGLRGRGGAGFPTGLKWEFCRKAEGDTKYVLCNADEGDPGAFMDRSVLEGDPHSVIEAMAIAGYAIGSSQGYIYVRAEYPLAVKRLTTALQQAKEFGLLGDEILGTGFCFDLEIRQGSGAFVCGEETALMRSIEGKRGEPRPRPPFPAQKGLWDMPSLLNNVETYANIPSIILKGPEWFAGFGTEKSKGTKVFALAGVVHNTGLVEIPIGTPLGEIIFDIGGGMDGGKRFKAAQIGGPSGGCIPRQHLNVPVDYESLIDLGAIMGSGGLIVMDEDTCMVDMARFFLEFVQDESCGKCPPCRIGTKRMLEIVTRICEGKGQEGDIEKLERLGGIIKETSLCGLGQTAPNPVLSTIIHFRDEYEEHIRQKRCAAGVCADLVRAPCQNACPAGVDVPGFVSLIGENRYPEAIRLHRERNPFVSVCSRVCFHPCEAKCRRATLDAPVAIRGLKRFMAEQEETIQLPEIRADEANARRKVGIIGAGPAGLSCAYFLARLGYRPRVFEATSRPGGMLVQSIPAYRLPREELQREIQMIERMGVDIKTSAALGRDFTLTSLREEGYEAVFLAVGAPEGAPLRLPGRGNGYVVDAIEFLREYNLHGSVHVGQRVVVIGGGNAAVDAARTALRLGAESISILYRRTREEMPAYAEEIHEAEAEGVHLELLTAPHEIVTHNGHLAGLKCHRMQLGEFDRSGRRRPVVIEDDSFLVEADQIIAAIGQRLHTDEMFDGFDVELTSANFVRGNHTTGQTSVSWLFAGGDATQGPASVVEAIAGGERAAVGIHAYLGGEADAFWRRDVTSDAFLDPEVAPVEYPRARTRVISVGRRERNFNEIERPFGEVVAIREAKRCLRCDYRADNK